MKPNSYFFDTSSSSGESDHELEKEDEIDYMQLDVAEKRIEQEIIEANFDVQESQSNGSTSNKVEDLYKDWGVKEKSDTFNSKQHWEWKSINFSNAAHQANVRQIFTEKPGLKIPHSSIVDLFEYFFDVDLLELMMNHTNLNASIKKAEREKKNLLKKMEWTPTDIKEMYLFLAFLILMGIDQKPSLKSYYCENTLLQSKVFPSTIPLQRFRKILKYLRFSDSRKECPFKCSKKLCMIEPVLFHLNYNFRSAYKTTQNLSINESVWMMKGRLPFQKYVPVKSSEVCVRAHELCETSTGYTSCVSLQLGSSVEIHNSDMKFLKSHSLPTQIVFPLMKPFFGKGYTLWLNSCYNSPELSNMLRDKNTDSCGPLKSSSKNYPSELKNVKLMKNEVTGFGCRYVSVFKWKDETEVSLISTFSPHTISPPSHLDPKLQEGKIHTVLHSMYNRNMKGVDLRDKTLHRFQPFWAKEIQWHLAVFMRLLNITLYNACVIWKAKNPKTNHLKFRLDLIRGLLEKYATQSELPSLSSAESQVSRGIPRRLTERHFPDTIPPYQSKAPKVCLVCSSQEHEVSASFWCSDCGVYFCELKCFRLYHTKRNYRAWFDDIKKPF